MKRKFFLYAGFYEMLITDRRLRRPYSLVSTHRSLEAAEEAARRNDPDQTTVYDQNIKKDVAEAYPMLEDINILPFFDGGESAIEKGLSDYTLERLRRKYDCKATFLCLCDIAAWLALKTGRAMRTISKQIAEMTYAQLYEIVKPFIPDIDKDPSEELNRLLGAITQ